MALLAKYTSGRFRINTAAALTMMLAAHVVPVFAQGVPEIPFAQMPHAEALADRLESVTLRDPNQQPYVYSTVLPPRRPSDADLLARRNRAPLREAAPRSQPTPAASRVTQSTRSLCTSARCPHANMIGIQY